MFTSYKEKFTKIDDEKRVKEAEAVEGGYLDIGFIVYWVRFEIIEKGEDCCITRPMIEYDAKEEAATNASCGQHSATRDNYGSGCQSSGDQQQQNSRRPPNDQSSSTSSINIPVCLSSDPSYA